MNLGYIISRSAQWYRDRIAVVSEFSSYTFKDINDNCNRLANGLLKLGVAKGDRVVILASNCPEYIEADFAIYKGGFVRVALNPRLAPHEITFIINDCRANTLLITGDQLDAVREIQSTLRHIENCICISGDAADMTDYHSFIREQPTTEPRVDIGEGDLAQLFYTGGTTGVPKGAMLTHGSVIAISLNIIGEMYRLNQHDVFLTVGTLAHGNAYRPIPLWAVGAKNIIMKTFDPDSVLQTVEREGVTLLGLVPTTVQLLADFPRLQDYKLDSLRVITYGGAPYPLDKLKQAIEVFGKRLCQLYGQGEAPVTIAYLSGEDHILDGSREELRRLASIGRPYITVEVRVVDNDGNDVQPGDEVGEIVVRSKHMMKGYYGNPEASREAMREGWLHTGDLARIDDKGYIYVVDRAKDMIISGGYNVFAHEVETVISSHPAVAEVAVIGVPDDRWGEAVKAVVVLKSGADSTEQEIIEYCRDKLTSYKKPKSVDFADRLPRTSLGKVLKRDLRSKYWEGQERQVH